MHFTPSITRIALVALVAAAAFLLPAVTTAQVVEPGVRIRVTDVGGSRHTGTFEALDADSVRLLTPSGSIAVPMSSLVGLDVSIGRHRQFGRNLLLTVGAFALLAGAVSAVTYERCEYCFATPGSRAEAFVWGAVVGSGVGTPVGVLLGAVLRHERWAAVYRPAAKPLRVSLRPAAGGRVGFALTATGR